MNNLLSKALEEMRWYDQPRVLLEMYLLKMSEPYYNVGELIDKITNLEKSIKIGDNCTAEQSLEQNKVYAADKTSSDSDLRNAWEEIVSDIIKKHPLTAQPLKKVSIKIVDVSSIQLTVSGQLEYDSVLDFQEQILKLFEKKTGLNVTMKVTVEKNISENKTVQKDKVIKKENSGENAKTAIPKHIEEIAKKFESVAKKV
jgi:DNA polymerase-3 subunit gamma/tau